jgi:2-haloacid dehalogenase
MEQNKIDTIVFDFGGVLIDWNPRYVYRDIFHSVEAQEYFLREICSNAWNELQDEGRSFAEATKILTSQYPHYTNEIEAYYGRWKEMLKGAIPETVQLLAELKKSQKYRLYGLTNWSDESFPVALDRFEFLHWFDGILVSGVEKMKKPDPKIFHLLINRYDITPQHALFIDDNITNVKAAADVGFQTIHFRGADQCPDILHMLMA